MDMSTGKLIPQVCRYCGAPLAGRPGVPAAAVVGGCTGVPGGVCPSAECQRIAGIHYWHGRSVLRAELAMAEKRSRSSAQLERRAREAYARALGDRKLDLSLLNQPMLPT